MSESLLVNTILSTASTISFSVAALYVSVARRHRMTWKAATITLAICAEVSLARTLQILSPEFTARVFWFKMSLLGFSALPLAFLFLALRYSGNRSTRKLHIVASLFPLLMAIMLFTNEFYGWIWDPTQTASIANSFGGIPVADARLGYWIFALGTYFISGLGAFFLIRSIVRARKIHKWQGIAILIAGILIPLGLVIDIFSPNSMQPLTAATISSIAASAITAIMLAVVPSRDLLSITRGAIFNSISDAIIIVDAKDQVVDLNPAAEKLAGKSAVNLIGKSPKQIFPHINTSWSTMETDQDISLQTEDGTRALNLRISYVRDWQNHAAGKVITLHDVTDVKSAKKELAANREDEKNFSEGLTTLANITNELSKAKTLDELCLQAVEAARGRLSFDRVAIWFTNEKHDTMIGTYGTDTQGRTTDERQARHPIVSTSSQQAIINGKLSLKLYQDAPLFDKNGDQVGTGERVTVGLWDGETVIGFISIDNFIYQKPFSEYDLELMRIYASNVGHLCNLKLAQEKLTQLADTLEQRVAERTSELEAANKELEAFAYSVSHDLRAPLRAIDGYTRIIYEEYASVFDEDGRRICNDVRENAHRMDKLINDLLTFSRLSRTAMQTTSIDMQALVESVIQELTNPEDSQHIRFQIGVLSPATGDPSLIRQVWVNLLSNAIKFSAMCEPAIIEITCAQANEQSIYAVKDNGAGFDMQYTDKLFGVFQRLHSQEEFPGTGIGLAIVQRIVHRHGGHVWAEGVKGKGATFYFTL